MIPYKRISRLRIAWLVLRYGLWRVRWDRRTVLFGVTWGRDPFDCWYCVTVYLLGLEVWRGISVSDVARGTFTRAAKKPEEGDFYYTVTYVNALGEKREPSDQETPTC